MYINMMVSVPVSDRIVVFPLLIRVLHLFSPLKPRIAMIVSRRRNRRSTFRAANLGTCPA